MTLTRHQEHRHTTRTIEMAMHTNRAHSANNQLSGNAVVVAVLGLATSLDLSRRLS